MTVTVIDNPIFNSPFAKPVPDRVLDDNGLSAGIAANGRSRVES